MYWFFCQQWEWSKLLNKKAWGLDPSSNGENLVDSYVHPHAVIFLEQFQMKKSSINYHSQELLDLMHTVLPWNWTQTNTMTITALEYGVAPLLGEQSCMYSKLKVVLGNHKPSWALTMTHLMYITGLIYPQWLTIPSQPLAHQETFSPTVMPMPVFNRGKWESLKKKSCCKTFYTIDRLFPPEVWKHRTKRVVYSDYFRAFWVTLLWGTLVV